MGTDPLPRPTPERPVVWSPGSGPKGTPSVGTALVVVLGLLGLGRLLTGPPDEPERAEDRDLEDDEQEEDRPEPVHRTQSRGSPGALTGIGPPRLRAQLISASVWASSRPSADSVGTSSVGSVRL